MAFWWNGRLFVVARKHIEGPDYRKRTALYELSGNFEGRSGRRLKQVWDEISKGLVAKTKSYTLNQFSAKNPAEMYYI